MNQPPKGRAMAADALKGLLSGIESGIKLRESLAMAYWERSVGPQAAASSEPESVRDGIMFVRTKSSVWSQELKLMQGHIIRELNRRVGSPVIRDLIFRAQGVTQGARTKHVGADPSASDLENIVLPDDEQSRLTEEISELNVIVDPSIRQRVSDRLLREKRLRYWRLQRGWKECARCGSTHRLDGKLCPMCRIGS